MDILKIDKSFIDPLVDPTNEGDAFVATIIRLAKELRLVTVAEGIEYQVQRDTLIRLGCHDGQGYLLSRPLSASRAAELGRRQQEPARPELPAGYAPAVDPQPALAYPGATYPGGYPAGTYPAATAGT